MNGLNSLKVRNLNKAGTKSLIIETITDHTSFSRVLLLKNRDIRWISSDFSHCLTRERTKMVSIYTCLTVWPYSSIALEIVTRFLCIKELEEKSKGHSLLCIDAVNCTNHPLVQLLFEPLLLGFGSEWKKSDAWAVGETRIGSVMSFSVTFRGLTFLISQVDDSVPLAHPEKREWILTEHQICSYINERDIINQLSKIHSSVSSFNISHSTMKDI